MREGAWKGREVWRTRLVPSALALAGHHSRLPSMYVHALHVASVPSQGTVVVNVDQFSTHQALGLVCRLLKVRQSDHVPWGLQQTP